MGIGGSSPKAIRSSRKDSKEFRNTNMKRTLARFVLPLALLSVTAFAQTGHASPAPEATTGNVTKVGIINIQQAILLTNEGKRDLEALEKKFEPTRTELQGLQKEVEDMKKQLDTQGPKMNEEAKNNLVKDVDAKQKSLQRKLEDAQQDFQSQQGDIVNRIGGKLMQVIDKYAKANSFAAIFDVSNPQSPVLWAAQNTDVTKEIAEAYNAQSGIAAPASTPVAPTPRPSTTAHAPSGTAPKPR
jgi:Skp family chaperone for outer membrane proteins